jgi:hypothetical protein
LLPNPILRTVIASIKYYREGYLDAEGLQQNFAAVMSAVEGDVPDEIRNLLHNAEASIELIRFTVDSSEEAAALEKVFAEIENGISSYQDGSNMEPS